MYDICVISIPCIPYNLPPAAPAVIVGHLKSRGFSACAREYNLEFRHRLRDEDLLNKLIAYWKNDVVDLSESEIEKYNHTLDELARELASVPARWYGISVFTPHSRQFCQDFLPHLCRYRSEDSRILLGGLGLDPVFLDSVRTMIDSYILGEGELALEHLLNEDFNYPGINSPGEQISDLDVIGTPDYSDYNRLDQYETFYENPAIQLTGSRGCVRDCSFCNVATYWPKFRWRSGDLVAQDIISLHESTGMEHFFFTDSLINGNVKHLTMMMRILADYRKKHNKTFTWGGQWIARKQAGLPKDYYELIKASGGYNLTIGVETGSDAVRAHMKKGFTNHDLDLEMEQFSRHGITCSFYMMTGYITETRENFEETLDMFQRYSKYVADGTLVGVILSGTFNLLEGIPIIKEKDRTWAIEDGNIKKWRSLSVDLDYIESLRRRIIGQRVLQNLEWPSNNVTHELTNLSITLKKMLREKQQRNPESTVVDIDEEISQKYKLPENPIPHDIKFELTGTHCRHWPIIDIEINGKILTKDLVVNGVIEHTVHVNDPKRRNMIKIHLKNKTKYDTKVGDDGEIVEDMTVVVDAIIIDGVRVRHEDLYLKGSAKKSNGERLKAAALYYNGYYRFYYQNPVLPYFIRPREFFYSKYTSKHREMVEQLVNYFNQLK